MKEYFYVDDGKPVGPFSLDELHALHLAEKISLDTLVSKEGAQEWLPYAKFVPQAVSPNLPPMPSAAQPTAHVEPFAMAKDGCPYCQEDLAISEKGQVPYVCPKCYGDIHAKEKGIWDHFIYAFGKYATFKGRATRAELWSFVFFVIVIGFVFGVVGMIIPLVGFLFELVIFIPSLAILFRRFHDVGLSGWWVILTKMLSTVSVLYALYYFFSRFIAQLGGITKFEELLNNLIAYSNIADTSYDEILFERELDIFCDAVLQTWQQTILVVTLGTVLIPAACLVFVFIVCIIDSSRGVNKYGVSPKYPRA